MKIFLTGGTGFIGRGLAENLLGLGHEVTVLTRTDPSRHPSVKGLAYVQADPRHPGDWQALLADHAAVINLAGATIFRRWTASNKKTILESRLLTTRHLVEGLAARKGRETVLLSASGTGYYGPSDKDGLDENAPPGHDFLAVLSREWEAEACRAEAHGVRVVRCRLGVVLGKRGGALGRLVPIFRLGLGSPLGSGRQWFSWIHEKDLLRIFLFLLDRSDLGGPVNCTAPKPVRNRELTRILGKALRRPTFLPPVPAPLLRLVLGELSGTFLEGQCAVPSRLLQLGFSFRYPTLEQALADLVRNT